MKIDPDKSVAFNVLGLVASLFLLGIVALGTWLNVVSPPSAVGDGIIALVFTGLTMLSLVAVEIATENLIKIRRERTTHDPDVVHREF